MNEYPSWDLIIPMQIMYVHGKNRREKFFLDSNCFLLRKTDDSNVVEICSSDHERLWIEF